MDTTQKLVTNYLNQYFKTNELDVQTFLEQTTMQIVKKGEVILSFEKKCNYQYFIIEGLFISYIIDGKGENKVIQISSEGSWTGDLKSYVTNEVSSRTIKALENSKILLLKKTNWEVLLTNNPNFEKLFRVVFQNAYINQTKRIENNLCYDAQKRLALFLNENPEIMKRVQKKVIASYLDMTPETLSRCLKKICLI